MFQQLNNYLNYNYQPLLQQIVQKYSLTQKNTKVLIKYYNHFKKVLDKNTYDQSYSKNIAEISLILTQKSNFYETIQGNRRPGICFSINQILKNKNQQDIRQFINLSKQILEKAKFKDRLLQQQVKRLTQQIEISLEQKVLFKKLFFTFYKNTLEQSFQFQFFKTKLLDFGWYLYIDAKYTLCQKDYEFTIKKFLMLSVLQMVVLHSLKHIHPLILQKNSPIRFSINPSQHKKQLMSLILQILLRQANIQPTQVVSYRKISSAFDNYFDKLIEKSVIKSFSEQKFDFLCLRSLQMNLRKLDRKINKEIKSDQIDLRKLLNAKLEQQGQQSHKRTVIQDKLIINYKKNDKRLKIRALQSSENQCKKVYKSHRILNLDECEVENPNYPSIFEQNFSQPLPFRPLFANKQLIRQSTRINIPCLHQVTQKDELSSFIMQKTRSAFIQMNKKYQPWIIQYVQNIYLKLIKQFPQQRSQLQISKQQIFQTCQFYEYLCSKSWSRNPQKQRQIDHYGNRYYILQQSESTRQCMLIVSISTILMSKYKKMSTQQFVDSILAKNSIDFLNLFYTLIYIKQTISVPVQLNTLIKNILNTIINEYLWSDYNFIEEISFITQIYENKDINSSRQRQSISCVLEQVAQYVIKKIDSFVKIFCRCYQKDDEFLSKVNQWKTKTVQYCFIVLTFMPYTMFKHNLDQLLLCTLYGISRIIKLKIKFQDLIAVYKQTRTNQSSLLQKTILNVKNNKSTSSFSPSCQPSEPQYFKDIIEFYNKQFIEYLTYCSLYNQNKKYLMWIQQLTNFKVEFNFGSNEEQKMDDGGNITPFDCRKQVIVLSPRMRNNKSPVYAFYSNENIPNETQNYNNDHQNTNDVSIYDDENDQMIINEQDGKQINIVNLEQFQVPNDVGQLGIYSNLQGQNQYQSEQAQDFNYQNDKQNFSRNNEENQMNYMNDGKNKNIVNKNLEVSNGSRNPTRIKQRKNLDELTQQLCFTKKAKHPIFTEFSNE